MTLICNEPFWNNLALIATESEPRSITFRHKDWLPILELCHRTSEYRPTVLVEKPRNVPGASVDLFRKKPSWQRSIASELVPDFGRSMRKKKTEFGNHFQTRSWEEGIFSTAIFNSDIELSVYSFSCFVSVCPFVASLKATDDKNSHIVLSCWHYLTAFIFNLSCVFGWPQLCC